MKEEEEEKKKKKKKRRTKGPWSAREHANLLVMIMLWRFGIGIPAAANQIGFHLLPPRDLFWMFEVEITQSRINHVARALDEQGAVSQRHGFAQRQEG